MDEFFLLCDSVLAARENKMLRVLLTATAISFVLGGFPAFAQGDFNCTDWCHANRCKQKSAVADCLPRCVDACQAQHDKTKK
jgi:hypothetical protein